MTRLSSGLKEGLTAFVVIFGILLLCFWRYAIPRQCQDSLYFSCDFLGQQYPNALIGRQWMKEGAMPFWEPYSGLGGRPDIADPSKAYFILPNLLTYAIGIVFKNDESYQAFWILRVLAVMAFGGVGVFLMLRRLGVRKEGAYLGAVTFTLAAFQQATMHLPSFTDAFALVPWTLWASLRLADRPNGRRFFLLSFFVSQMVLGTYANFSLYSFLMVALWLLGERTFSADHKRPVVYKQLLLIGAAFGGGLCLGLIQILPTLNLMKFTTRPFGFDWSMSYQRVPAQLFELFWPTLFVTPLKSPRTLALFENVTLYVGIVPLVVLCAAMLRSGGELIKKRISLLLILAMPFVAWTFASETRMHDLLYLTVPLVGSLRACNDAWIVAVLFIALGTGIGLEEMLSRPEPRARSIWRAGIIVALLALVVLVPAFLTLQQAAQAAGADKIQVFQHLLGEILRFGTWELVAIFLLISSRWHPKLAAALLCLLAAFDLTTHIGKNGYCNRGTVSPARVMSDNRLTQFLRQELAGSPMPMRVRFHFPDNPLYFRAAHLRFFTTDGHTATPLRTESVTPFLLPDRAPALPLTNVALEVTSSPLAGSEKIFELTVSPEEESHGDYAVFQDPGYRKRAAGEKIFVYRNKETYPRAFFLQSLKMTSAGDPDWSTLFAGIDPRVTALVRPEDLPSNVGLGPFPLDGNRVNSIKYSRNGVLVGLTAPKGGILFMSDTYLPGWSARTERGPAEIFQVDGKFRAIMIPAGASRLTLSFMPPGFALGLAGSAVTMVILACLCLPPLEDRWRRIAAALRSA